MGRYIDAEILLEDVHTIVQKRENGETIESVVYAEQIEDAPTADVVPVVRCKDCRWGKESCGNIECFADTNVPPEYHGYDWFCSNGEKASE